MVATVAVLLAVAGCGSSSHKNTATTSSGATPSSRTGSGTGTATASSTTTVSRSHHGGSAAAQSTTSSAANATGAKPASKHRPAAVIATVAGRQITLAAYQRAYGAELRSATAGGVPLDPPTFTRCAKGLAHQLDQLPAALKKLKKIREHRPPLPSHAALIKDCQERQRGLQDGTITQLIEQRWYELQAQADGLNVSAAAVRAAVANQRKALGGAAAYARYLRRVGETQQQALAQMRLDLIEQRLQQRRLGAPVSISNSQVSAFFTAHHAEFVLPGDKHPKLSQYSARIRLVLAEQVRARRAAAATTAFERHWRAQTTCSAGYVVTLCAHSA